jgi:hypothetical protein
MRMSSMVIAAVFMPALSMAQVAPAATPSTKAVLEQMQANVSQITAPGEKERWNVNLSMWKLVFAKPGKLATANVDTLRASLRTLRTNVNAIVGAAEKERWTANLRLWQAFASGNAMAPMMNEPCCAGAMPMASMPMAGRQMGAMPANRMRQGTDAAFGRMTLNVAKISEPQEKERWQANCELWTAILAPQP